MAIRRSNDSSRTTTPATATPTPTKPTKPAQPANSVTQAKPVTPSSTPTPAPAATTTTAATPPRRRAKLAQVSADIRRAMIAESAYLRSERRGFVPGFEEQDWLAAEKEIDTLLSAGPGASQ
jgi:cell division septation protein DedD